MTHGPERSVYMCDFVLNKVSTIGTAPDCHVRLASAVGVAEKHAEIEYKGDHRFEIRSLSSEHTTLVDNVEIRRKLIRIDSVIRFGPQTFRFDKDRLISTSTAASLAARNLSYSLPNKGGLRILADVSFDVQEGALVGILGPSGCGKSTLLDCLVGLRDPTTGQVVISRGARTGYVPQENVLTERLTVEENLRLAAVIRHPDLPDADVHKRIAKIITAIGLSDKSDTLVKDLSGGQTKRVNVAVELLSAPQILFLDEPTSGLDPVAQKDFMGLLGELRKRGTTIVCVTHALDAIDYLDHIVILRKLDSYAPPSSVVYRGTCHELLAQYNHNRVSLADVYKSEATAPPLEDELPDDRAAPSAAERRIDAQDASSRPFWPGVQATLTRTALNLWRTRLNLIMTLLLPVILGGFIFLSQAKAGGEPELNTLPVLLILVISALWLGMTLSVREVVAERALCERDLRAGMGKLEYVTGKFLYVAILTASQAMLLAGTLFLLSNIAPWGLGDPQYTHTFANHATWLLRGELLALWVCTLCGGLTGLAISSFSRTQALAITLIPLFLIPHLLFNRSVYGHIYDVSTDDTAYSPIRYAVVPDNSRDTIHLIGSFPLVSRPVIHVMLASNPYGDTESITEANINSFSDWLKLEWFYLFVLMSGHILLFLVCFAWRGPGSSMRGRLRWLNRAKQ